MRACYVRETEEGVGAGGATIVWGVCSPNGSSTIGSKSLGSMFGDATSRISSGDDMSHAKDARRD